MKDSSRSPSKADLLFERSGKRRPRGSGLARVSGQGAGPEQGLASPRLSLGFAPKQCSLRGALPLPEVSPTLELGTAQLPASQTFLAVKIKGEPGPALPRATLSSCVQPIRVPSCCKRAAPCFPTRFHVPPAIQFLPSVPGRFHSRLFCPFLPTSFSSLPCFQPQLTAFYPPTPAPGQLPCWVDGSPLYILSALSHLGHAILAHLLHQALWKGRGHPC